MYKMPRDEKGQPRMTISSLRKWSNTYLKSHDGHEVCENTIREWVKKCGFKFFTKKKGVYIDGHDREDVAEHRKEFVTGEELDELSQPLWLWDTKGEKWRHVDEIEGVELCNKSFFGGLGGQFRDDVEKKCVSYWHDESIFNANNTESSFWGTHGEPSLMSKGKGGGDNDFGFYRRSLWMVSTF